jgi:tyrosine-protein kinase Etk/Wzc
MQTVKELSHVSEAATSSDKPPAQQFDLLDVMIVFAAGKRIIFLSTVACLAIAIIMAYVKTPSFTAKAIIMPPQSDQSGASSILGQLSGLAALGGGSMGSGMKGPADLYIGILQSESVMDAVIKRFGLMKAYHVEKWTDLRNALRNSSKFVAGKDGLITISVTNTNPKLAADLANGFIAELYALNNRLAVSGASQRRLFFEQQLAQEKDRLADAEVALEKTQESTGVIAPTGQTEQVIRQVAQLQAEITAREVQLESLRTYSTEQNSEVVRISAELNSLRAQLRDQESGKSKRTPGDISITTANVPQAGLEYIRRERDVKYHQLLFDLLAHQYEGARIDEAKAAPLIQIVDPALVPDKKSSPYRALWAVVGCALGFFLGCAWVFGSYIYRWLESDEDHRRRLALLRQELKLRA